MNSAVTPDIPYLGADRSEKMDLYQPAARTQDPLPAILIIHGGGWTTGSKSSRRELQMAETFCAAGYVCASIDYRLASEGNPTWPGVLHDCRAAVHFLRLHAGEYGIDPDRIGAIGGSAGGCMSLLLGAVERPPSESVTPPVSGRVQAVVALYPPTDMLAAAWERRILFGVSRSERPDVYREASPVHRLTPDYPPTLILHGTADAIVPVSQSHLLDEAMTRLSIPHELIIVPDAPHTFILHDEKHDFRQRVIDFFDQHLGAPGPRPVVFE